MPTPDQPPRRARTRIVKEPLTQREGVAIDFFFLADSAQTSDGKLHMLGGGWSRVVTQKLPTVHPMAIAAGVGVPWLETNIKHHFVLEIRNEDTNEVLVKAEGAFETGRPSGMAVGSRQRALIAMTMGLQFSRAGQHVAELCVNGGAVIRREPFEVVYQGPAH